MSGKRRGQAFVELALIMPIMLIMIAGMVEVVFAFNDYLQMLDGARNGARDSANLNPYPKAGSAYDADKDCADTNNFWRRTACNTKRFLLPVDINRESSPYTAGGPDDCISRAIEPDKFVNDIVISIFTTAVVDADGPGGNPPTFEVRRFKDSNYNGGNPYLVEDANDVGWSFVMDQTAPPPGPRYRGMCSAFDTGADITPLLLGSGGAASAAPNTAYLLVEVFYRHYQLFDLPAFGDVIENPIRLHAYAIFPISAAEATPTPEP